MNPFHISFDPSKSETWVGVGLLIFLGIVIFVAKAPQIIAGRLDAQRDAIQNDLDEAARITVATVRAEAPRLPRLRTITFALRGAAAYEAFRLALAAPQAAGAQAGGGRA